MLMLRKIAVAAVAILGAVGVSAETTITFDEIELYQSYIYIPIYDGYAGFHWDNFVAVWGGYSAWSDKGFGHSVVSERNAAYNGSGDPASFSSDTPFDLTSIFVTKAWNDGYTRFVGYVGSVQTYMLDVYSTTEAPVPVSFPNWLGVTRVEISIPDDSFVSVIDNLVINGTVSQLPIPAAAWLLGTGLLGMAGVGRKKKAQKELAA